MKAVYLTITAALVSLSMALSAHASDVTLNVTDLRSAAGMIRIGLYQSIKAYDAENPVKALIVTAEEASQPLRFENVPEGEYLIALYHDEDSNGKMNMKLFGLLPEEGYGFSKNPGSRFGPPDLTKAMFNVTETANLTLNIQVKY